VYADQQAAGTHFCTIRLEFTCTNRIFAPRALTEMLSVMTRWPLHLRAVFGEWSMTMTTRRPPTGTARVGGRPVALLLLVRLHTDGPRHYYPILHATNGAGANPPTQLRAMDPRPGLNSSRLLFPERLARSGTRRVPSIAGQAWIVVALRAGRTGDR